LIVYILLNNKWNNETKKISLKQKEVLEKQVEDSQKLADWLSEKSSSELSSKSDDTDHSFAKRVADEIVRMSTNLSRMDDSIRGFKQLSASVRKLIQSLSINEYEIVELLNKPYSSGMNLEANFVFNEEIEKGSQIITRIIKPQINYKGKMIQGAQVEVSQND
jgi:CRISPR/Cas system-associated endonuclease Cas3-HD